MVRTRTSRKPKLGQLVRFTVYGGEQETGTVDMLLSAQFRVKTEDGQVHLVMYNGEWWNAELHV